MRASPSLKQLHHLVALAEHRHFGRAAEACFVTQSTLSSSLKELETLLDAHLVERTKRRVIMTPLGEACVTQARVILLQVEGLLDLVAGAQAPLSGPLRLGVIPTISPFLLPRILPLVRKAYPDLQLYLREEQSADALHHLETGALDLVLLALPYPIEGFTSLTIAEDSFWAVMPRQHKLSQKERVNAEHLKGEALLLLEDGHCLRDQALSFCKTLAPGTKESYYATSLLTLVQMVENGLGLTIIPKMAIDGGLLKGTRLTARPLEGRNASRQIALITRKASTKSADCKALGDIIRNELATPIKSKKQGSKKKA